MIFITLGTQDKHFNRLINKVDELIETGVIKEEVIAQLGCTKYNGKNIQAYELMNEKDYLNNIEKASFVICHGGVGSILDSLKLNKKVIAVPRKKEFGESVNDHQEEVILEMVNKKHILSSNVDDLEIKIKEIKKFKPKKYVTNNKKIINIIEKFIDEN